MRLGAALIAGTFTLLLAGCLTIQPPDRAPDFEVSGTLPEDFPRAIEGHPFDLPDGTRHVTACFDTPVPSLNVTLGPRALGPPSRIWFGHPSDACVRTDEGVDHAQWRVAIRPDDAATGPYTVRVWWTVA